MTVRNSKRKPRLTQEELISKFIKIHGERYDYSIIGSTKSTENIDIICKRHGIFSQKVTVHLRGSGCPECFQDSRLPQLDEMIQKIKIKHGDRYDLSKFKRLKSVDRNNIVICRKHGEFKTSYNKLTIGNGCPKCCHSFKRSAQEKINELTAVHGCYDYSLVNFDFRVKEKIPIVCESHGIFYQTFSKHKSGQGCPECAIAGWSKSKYIEICKTNKGMSNLYLVAMHNDSEFFYKVGITKHDINFRMNRRNNFYKYEVIHMINGDASFIWDLEKRLHKALSKHKYVPRLPFAGHTECFSEITKPVHKLLRELSTTEQLQLIA